MTVWRTPAERTKEQSRSHLGGHAVFFPLAAAYAALSVPLWLAGYSGWLPPLPPSVHAHEMLMGFALAVVGGFLLTKPRRGALFSAVLAWLAGRIAGWLPMPQPVALLCALAYPIVLFVLAGLPFLRATKSAHNAVFGPLIGAFIPAVLLFHVSTDSSPAARLSLYLAALLLFTMGGRVIPAAVAGALRRRGGLLVERVQRPLEWTGIAAILTAGVLTLWESLGWLAALASLLGGAMAWLRLARWHPLATLNQPDLWSLHLGYAWLGLGLTLAGVQQLSPLAASTGLHALSIGALGTLAASMMVRASLQRGRHPMSFPPAAVVAIFLISIAALLRLAVPLGAEQQLLAVSALLWSGAQLLLLEVLRRLLWKRAGR